MKIDILSLMVFTFALTFTGTIAGSFDGGWAISNLLYAIAIFANAVHLPWVFIALIFPKSLNTFVNEHWDLVWSDPKADEDGTGMARIKVVLTVYLAFVVVFAVIGWAVFIGTPVGG